MREDFKKHFTCNDLDKIALDYYMGGESETAEEWFERVFTKCELYKKNGPIDDDGKKLASVYQNCPHALWENKKKRRREAIVKDLLNKECSCEEEETQALQDCLKHPEYKTRSVREAEEKALIEKEFQEERDRMTATLSKLRKKFDDDTILMLRPDLEYLIEQSKSKPSLSKKIGKIS